MPPQVAAVKCGLSYLTTNGRPRNRPVLSRKLRPRGPNGQVAGLEVSNLAGRSRMEEPAAKFPDDSGRSWPLGPLSTNLSAQPPRLAVGSADGHRRPRTRLAPTLRLRVWLSERGSPRGRAPLRRLRLRSPRRALIPRLRRRSAASPPSRGEAAPDACGSGTPARILTVWFTAPMSGGNCHVVAALATERGTGRAFPGHPCRSAAGSATEPPYGPLRGKSPARRDRRRDAEAAPRAGVPLRSVA